MREPVDMFVMFVDKAGASRRYSASSPDSSVCLGNFADWILPEKKFLPFIYR